jgi:hypothetical protein
MPRKRSLIFSILIISISGCSSGDISVTSDIGEKIIIKSSSITALPYDKAGQIDALKKGNAEKMDGYQSCVERGGITPTDCWEIWGEKIVGEETFSKINALPKMKTIRYRTIFVDINGDKKASGYETVTCIPDGTEENRKKWSETINGVSNILQDSTVANIAIQELCKKYGN